MSDAENTNKAIATMANLASGAGIMSTIEGNDFESKKQILNAVTNAEDVSDNLNTAINLVHVVTQAVSVTDTVTGDPRDVVRTILIDDNGKSFACVSDGVVGSLRDIFGVIGHPSTWDQPLPVMVVEQKGNQGRKFFKIVLA